LIERSWAYISERAHIEKEKSLLESKGEWGQIREAVDKFINQLG